MGIQDYLIDIGYFINDTIIPFLFALALLFFLYNVARYFILGAAEKDAREKARRLALYGVAAFVLMVGIWGIVNLIASALDINYSDESLCPDYMSDWCFDSTYYEDEYYDPFSDLPQQRGGPGTGAF